MIEKRSAGSAVQKKRVLFELISNKFAMVLLGIVIFLAFKLHEKNEQLDICRKKMREERETTEEKAMAKVKEREVIWDRINAIHLYAALSKEETRSRSVREKQEAILRIAEQLLGQSREQE